MLLESEQGDQELAREVQRADVVCLVYAVDDQHSLQQITERWLPLIRSLRPSIREDEEQTGEIMSAIPIVLVGNKSDLLEQGNMEAVLPIMNHYAEIETCVEVSPYVAPPPLFRVLFRNDKFMSLVVLCEDTEEHFRDVLLCSKSRSSSYRASLHC